MATSFTMLLSAEEIEILIHALDISYGEGETRGTVADALYDRLSDLAKAQPR